MDIKKDNFLKNRKGFYQMYNLHCSKCNELISKYQKDGIGPLKRIYVDRIQENKYKDDFQIDKKLICPKCGKLLGLGYIYEKENRPAYKLFTNEINIIPTNKIKYLYYSIRKLILGEV